MLFNVRDLQLIVNRIKANSVFVQIDKHLHPKRIKIRYEGGNRFGKTCTEQVLKHFDTQEVVTLYKGLIKNEPSKKLRELRKKKISLMKNLEKEMKKQGITHE